MGRRVIVNDGIVDEKDIADGTLAALIPAGSVEVAVLEDSANGRVVLDVPTPRADDLFLPSRWTGRMIRKLSWTFEAGKVTSFQGDKNAEALRREWEESSGDKHKIATLSIGLNPKAKPGFLVNRIVRGSIGISIGGNARIGGANKSDFFYMGTIANPTLEADGTVIVHNGKLRT
jgi:leucyl aminopeptidase (aminopeptidase T)